MASRLAERAKRFNPYTPGIKPSWSVSQVRSALLGHECGDLSQSSMLAEAMKRDNRLQAVMSTRLNGLLGSPHEMLPFDDSDKAQGIADAIGESWFDIAPESEVSGILRDYWLLGGALAELKWAKVDGRWMPRLRRWDLQTLTILDEDEGYRYQLATRNGQVDINPGDGKWVLFAGSERWWLDGFIRALAISWLGKQFAIRDWLRQSERIGQPIVLLDIPAIADDEDADAFFDLASDMSSATTMRLPTHMGDNGEKFDARLLESQGHGWQSFGALIRHIDDDYAIRFLGNNLTTMVDGGSFAASKTGDEVRVDYKRHDAEMCATIFRDQVCKPLAGDWFPNGAELAPWPKWQVEPPEDLLETAGLMKVVGEGMSALKTAGATPSLEVINDKFGLELEEVEEPEPQVVPQEPQGTPEEPEEDEGTELSLLSGDAVSEASGFIAGQAAADILTEDGRDLAAKSLRPTIKTVLGIIDDVIGDRKGPITEDVVHEIEGRMVEAFSSLDTYGMSAWLERALMLAEMHGRAAVLEDL